MPTATAPISSASAARRSTGMNEMGYTSVFRKGRPSTASSRATRAGRLRLSAVPSAQPSTEPSTPISSPWNRNRVAIAPGVAPRVRSMAIAARWSITISTRADTTLKAATPITEASSNTTRSLDSWIAAYRLPWVERQLVA